MKYQCHFHCCATQKNTGFVSMLDLAEASVFTGWINWQRWWFHLSKHLSGRPRGCIAVSWIRRQGPFIWLPASGQRAQWGLLQNLCFCLNLRPEGVPISLSATTTSQRLASVCSWGALGCHSTPGVSQGRKAPPSAHPLPISKAAQRICYIGLDLSVERYFKSWPVSGPSGKICLIILKGIK